jgi:hypothetical protein
VNNAYVKNFSKKIPEMIKTSKYFKKKFKKKFRSINFLKKIPEIRKGLKNENIKIF